MSATNCVKGQQEKKNGCVFACRIAYLWKYAWELTPLIACAKGTEAGSFHYLSLCTFWILNHLDYSKTSLAVLKPYPTRPCGSGLSLWGEEQRPCQPPASLQTRLPRPLTGFPLTVWRRMGWWWLRLWKGCGHWQLPWWRTTMLCQELQEGKEGRLKKKRNTHVLWLSKAPSYMRERFCRFPLNGHY